jgi:hypothetical protein
MADPPRYPAADHDTGGGSDPGPTTGAPSWAVKAVLIIVGLIFVLVIVLHIMGGGFRGIHGP